MSASKQRWWILICSLCVSALLAGSLAGGFGVWYNWQQRVQDPEFLQKQLDLVGPQDSGGGDGSLALIRVGRARRKRIAPQRPISGRLEEVRKVTVSSEVPGKIAELPVEEGTPVVKDETILARVDDVWCRFALERSRARVTSTTATLNYEKLELKLGEALIAKNGISVSQLEAKQAAVAELEASLYEAEQAVEEETERLARSVIHAPFTGIVVAKHAEVGKHVSPGTPIVDIVSRGQVDARLMVPESLVNLISAEQSMAIRVDPLGEEVIGRVVSVTPYGPGASRTFPVRVRLDDQEGRLKVGMSVTALIQMGPEREALVVSKDAVLVRPDGATVWVAVSRDEQQAVEAQPVPVTLGARMQEEYAIESITDMGRALLTEGTEVVIEGAERLTPGQQVQIVSLDEGSVGVAERQITTPPAPPTTSVKAADSSVKRQES